MSKKHLNPRFFFFSNSMDWFVMIHIFVITQFPVGKKRKKIKEEKQIVKKIKR